MTESKIINIKDDPEFVRYRRKVKAIAIILVTAVTTCMMFLLSCGPLSSGVKSEIAPYGMQNYFRAENDRGLVHWRAGDAEYEEFIPYVCETQAESLGKNIRVYANENVIIDTVSESELKRLALVTIAEDLFLGVVSILFAISIVKTANRRIEKVAADRLEEIAAEIRAKREE